MTIIRAAKALVAALPLAAGRLLLFKSPASVRRMVLAGAVLAGLGWALWPTAEYLTRTKAAILTDQLRGHGCQFQEPNIGGHSLNPLATLAIRHPEFYCPMWAADHLAATARGLSTAERDGMLKAFDEALKRQPDTYDTGDGIIKYGEHLRQARTAFLTAR